jgi:hypothetical protein
MLILITTLLLQIMLAHKAIAACGTSPENVAKLLIIKAGKITQLPNQIFPKCAMSSQHAGACRYYFNPGGTSQTIKWPKKFNYYPP